MSDELRAAASRLNDRDLADYQGPTGDDTDMRAGIMLAHAYLAEHPADGESKAQADEIERLRDDLTALMMAIGKHHSQHADDLCWMDDDELYTAAGLPAREATVGDAKAMLRNYKRFIRQRCFAGGEWKSYAELEAEIEWLRERMAAQSELLSRRAESSDAKEQACMESMNATIYKCPHCGREYSANACDPLVPAHNLVTRNPEDSMGCTLGGLGSHNITPCPGSGQAPRNAESDHQPLWKDGGCK